jgi:hypothetical protein
MTELGAGKGGTGRKTAVYRAMHIAEQSTESYATWKRATEEKVRARNKLRKVYMAVSFLSSITTHGTQQNQFGPIMFLDPFWHPRNLQPNHRSSDFSETLDQLIKSIPSNGSRLGEQLSSSRLALSTALDVFWSSASDYVMAFCTEHPPNISLDDMDSLDSDL